MKSGITFSTKGDFKRTTKFLNKLMRRDYATILSKYGEAGVQALSGATPVDTGKTAASWYYEIQNEPGRLTISWLNSNNSPTNQHVNIAILLQYGHATRNGGYVVGRDYINPAIQPVFDEILKDVWKEVTDA